MTTLAALFVWAGGNSNLPNGEHPVEKGAVGDLMTLKYDENLFWEVNKLSSVAGAMGDCCILPFAEGTDSL